MGDHAEISGFTALESGETCMGNEAKHVRMRRKGMGRMSVPSASARFLITYFYLHNGRLALYNF